MTVTPDSDDPLAAVLDVLQDEYDGVRLEGRTVILDVPVKGDVGFAALRILGTAQAASPVGVAVHGPSAVAIGVWRVPELYVARWTQNRWVVGYRLARGSRPGDHIRSTGRIPSHFETGNWYEDVPDDVVAAFADVGLSVDDPPFPPPKREPAPAPAPARTPPARRPPAARPLQGADRAAPGKAVATGQGRAGVAPPARTPRKPAPKPKPEPPPPDRVCPACNMRRARTQFTEGSDLCIDCR